MADKMGDIEEVSLEFGEEDKPPPRFRQPVAAAFHVLFRTVSLVAYLLCEWFSNSFIANFVIIIILLSMDFWTVKNITGRLLVGLRWWNHIDEDGKSQWIYESRKGAKKNLVTNSESRIFWLSLIVSQVLWTAFIFTSIIRFNFKWTMVVLVAFTLNGANFYGYVRCKMGSKNKATSAATNFLSRQMFSSMMSGNKANFGGQ